MKDRKLISCIGILVFVFLISLASALTIADKSISLSNTAKTGTVTITATGSEAFTINSLPPTQNDATNKIAFTLTNLVPSADGKSATVTVSAQELSDVSFLDSFSTTFVLTAQNSTGATNEFNIVASYENSQFCSEETSNNLDISIDSITTKSGFGDDEDYWYPMDEVEVEVQIEYSGSSKDEFQDGQLDWALYTSDGELVLDGDENIKDLGDGDDETITLSFKVDPEDLNVDTEDYVLYVSATGKEDYDDKTKTDKDICSPDSQDIEIRMDDNFVVADNIKFLPDPASCGSEVEITADVWNIGADDQEDVSVRVFIEDGITINQLVDIGDIDSFDKESLDLKINLPKNAEEKTYHLKLWVYDSDNDVYQNSEDDYSKFDVPFVVSGSCSSEPQVTVSASLESGGNSGQPLTIKAIITNTGNSLETFNLNVAGYDSFASSATLDQNTVAIGAGQSKEVLVTLEVKDDLSGEKSFNIEVSSGGNKLVTQPVQVTIQASTGLGGITGGIINEGNWYLWGIGALNIILVIIIIIVAIRIARS